MFAACAALATFAACFASPPDVASDADTSGGSSGDSSSGEDPSSAATTDAASSTTSTTGGSEASSGSESTSSTTGADEGTTTGAPMSCDRDAMFGPPTRLDELDTDAHEDYAWLSDDELVVYVSSNREGGAGGYDIYTAVRDHVTDPFGELVPLAGGGDEERRPALTADGLTLFVGAAPPTTSDYDIVVAIRDNDLAEFSDFAPLGGVNSDAIDRAPWISADGQTLYFETYRDGTLDLYRSARDGDGPFDTPTPVPELNTGSEDGSPVLRADGLEIFFSSNRDGGVGDYDVWVARRSSVDDGFGMAENVPEVSSDTIDWPTWVSADGCRLYLGSRRPDGGDYDLWMAERAG